MTTPQNGTVAAAGDGPGELAVVLRQVSHYFKSYQVRALTEISLQVRRGEIFGLLGPEGSGKSTVLKLVAGRLRATEGSVMVFDRSPRRPSMKARISYLAGAAGESDPTGWASIFKVFFRGKQNPHREPAAAPPGGTLRRAHLTRALARDADLLVLDEPFAGLDGARAGEVKELIRAFARRGRTVIFSSDSVADAKDLCDRLAILSGGKVQAEGTLDQLLAAPESLRFIAPVLPVAIAKDLLKIIREALDGNAPLPVSGLDSPPDAAANTASKIPQAESAATTTATDSILAPLLKANSSAPQTPPTAESRKAAADPVNHRKLAELTKPATDTQSTSKPA